MRRAAKVDANQSEIVQALRKAGCSVQSLAAVGKGVPDLLCAKAGKLWLMEVKNNNQPPSARRLTEDQVKWARSWQSAVFVVTTVDSALKIAANIARGE